MLLRPGQALDLMFAAKRLSARPECLCVDEADRPPARGVLRAAAAVVGPLARVRIARIAGVERAVCAADDVHEVHGVIVGAITLALCLLAPDWQQQRQRRGDDKGAGVDDERSLTRQRAGRMREQGAERRRACHAADVAQRRPHSPTSVLTYRVADLAKCVCSSSQDPGPGALNSTGVMSAFLYTRR